MTDLATRLHDEAQTWDAAEIDGLPQLLTEAGSQLAAIDSALSVVAVEEYIARLPFSCEATDTEKTLIVGNIRAFSAHLRALLASPGAPQDAPPAQAPQGEAQ